MYQRIGFQCFAETLFEDAGKYLFNGELDPRLLISYYPELRGSLFSSEDEIDIFAGVAERMPMEGSVDDISESTPSWIQRTYHFRVHYIRNFQISPVSH